jgi:broad specificity phosphatase PhoE
MSFRAAHLYAPDGGEDFDAVCARVSSFLDEVVATDPKRVAVVTHAGALHATLGVLGLTPPESGTPLNFFPCSFTSVVRENGAWRLISGPTALQ